MIRLIVAVMLFAVPVAAQAFPSRLPPTDSCGSDRSFAAFRNQLRSAVARRDARALLRLTSDDVANLVVNGELGRDAFSRAWGLDHPATSRLWHELEVVLRLGCGTDNHGLLWAPALRGTGEEDTAEFGEFTPMVAVGPAAILRAGPSPSSRAISRLRWDVVGPLADDGRSAWLHVRLANGRRGFVRRDQLRSVGDYSALFQWRNGRWWMIAFTNDDCHCHD